MANILVTYVSKHGQTAKIASHIAAVLSTRGHGVETRELPTVARRDLERADTIVLGAPLYLGRSSRALRRFLLRNCGALSERITALFTVCLTEAGNDEHAKQDVHRLVDTLLARTGVRPDETAVFAGALAYLDYNPIVRMIMKRIAATFGGNTDTSRDWEYTDWGKVEIFALRVAERVEHAEHAEHRAAAPVLH